MSITIAEAEASSATSGLIVADSAYNIAEGLIVAPNLATKVASFTFSASGLVTAALADHLAALGSKLHLGGYHLIVQDSLANLALPANAAGVALGTSVAVIDSAYDLLNAPLSRFAHVASVALTGSPTLSTAQVAHLLLLPKFSIAPTAVVTLSDTSAAISAAISDDPAWFGMVTNVVVRLSGSVGAYSAGLLEGAILRGRHVSFVAQTGDSTLNIDAALAGIAGNAALLNQLAGHVPLAFTIAGTPGAMTAAQGASLAGLTSFATQLPTVRIADTAVNVAANATALFSHNFAGITITSGNFAGTAAELLSPLLLLQGASATLSASVTVDGAQALALVALHGFSVPHAVTLTVSDTVADLVSDGAALAGYATAMVATGPATLDASAAQQLAAIATAVGAGFSLGGHTLTIADTAANLLGLTAAAHALAGAFVLTSNATLDAAQFTTLAQFADFSLGGYSLTISDTAGALAGLAGDADLSLVHSVALSASATISATEATLISGEPDFSTGGYQLTISDTAAAILGLSQALKVAATGLQLNAAASVSAAQLTALNGLGFKFSANGFAITVNDTAAALSALSSSAAALATSTVLSQSATVGAAEAAVLAALPGFAKAAGVSLTVQDSMTNLLGLSATTLAAASAELLVAGTILTLTAAQAGQLAALHGFSNAGASITVADTINNLQAASSWQTVATATEVVDTAANLVAGATTSLVHGAGSVVLSAGATITAANAATLASIPHFSRGGNLLIVADSVSGLTQYAAAVTGEASLAEVTGATPVTAAVAETLAHIAAAVTLTFLNGSSLVIADSYADIIATGNAAGLALASGLTIQDTAVNLATAALHGWGSVSPTYDLTASGTVTAAQLSALSGLGSRLVLGGFTLSLADSIAGVLGLSAVARDMAAGIAITDVSTNLTTSTLATLHFDLPTGTPLSITLTDAGNKVSVTAATYSADQNIIDDITNTGVIIVTDTAANIAGLANALNHDPRIASVAITDSAADIQANATALATLTVPMAVTLNGGGAVSASTLALLAHGTLTAGSNVITLADNVADVAALSTSARALAGAVAITDSTGDLNGTAFDTLKADFAASVPLTITLSNPTSTLSVTAATYSADTAQVDAVQNASVLAVTGAAADLAPVAAALALDHRVTSVVLTDTASAIDGQSAALSAATGKLAITLTQSGTVGAATLTMFAGAASLTDPDINLYLASSVAGVTGLSSVARGLASTITITDASTSLTTTALNTLQNDVPNPAILTINLTDAGHITVSTTTYNADQHIIDTISNQSVVVVSGSAAAIAAIAGTLNGDPRIAGVAITDTAAGIQTNAAVLANLTVPRAVTLSGSGSVTASTLVMLAAGTLTTGSYVLTLADNLADIAALTTAQRALAGAVAVTDTAADLVAGAASAIVQSAGSVVLSAGATITAANAATLASIPHFSRGGNLLIVADSAANIISYANAVISEASLAEVTGATPVTAAGAETLAHIAAAVTLTFLNGSSLVIADTYADIIATGNAAGLALASGLTIQDTAVNLAAAALHGWGSVSPTYDLTASGTVTAAQLSALSGLGSRLVLGGFTLSLADSIAGVLGLSAVARDMAAGIAITDVSTNLTTSTLATLHFDLPTGTPLSITLTDAGNKVSVTAATYSADQNIIDDITNTGVIIVTDTAANIAGLANALNHDPRIASVAITDSAADIQANATALATLTMPLSVTLNGGGAVSASTLALLAHGTLTAGSNVITLADNVADVAALSTSARALAGSVAITDSTGDLNGTAFDTLKADFAASVPLTITLSNPTSTLSVTAATYSADTAQVDAVQNASVLAVTGAAADLAPVAAALALDHRVTSVVLTDTASAIDGQSAALSAATGKLAITLTQSGTVGAATLTMFAGAASLTDPDINLYLASSVAGVTGLSSVARGLASTITITDASTSLTTTALNTLQNDVPNPAILTINLTDAGHITVSTTTYNADQHIIDTISNQSVVVVSGSAAAIAAIAGTLNGDPRIAGVAITDTAANIQASYTGLANLTAPLAVTLNGGGSVSASTLALLAASTLTAGSFVITLADSIAGITALTTAQRALAGAVAVTDSAGNLTGSAFDALQDDFAASVPLSITLSNPSVPVVVSAATYNADTAQVDAVQNATALQVTGNAAAIAPLAAALHSDGRVTAVLLTDSATAIDGLASQLTPVAAKLAITVNASGTVAAATLALLASAASLNVSGISLTLASTVAGVTGLSTVARGLASAIAITDATTSLNATTLNALDTDVTNPANLTITLTGGGHFAVTGATFSADQTIIDRITTTGVVIVSDTAATIAGLATALNNDPRVASVTITDSATDIQSNSLALASLTVPIKVILNGGGTVSASTLALMYGGGALVHGTYSITLADSLSGIATLSPTERALAGAVQVTDSAGNLTDLAFATLKSDFAASVPVTITLTNPTVPLALTAATYAADTTLVDAVQNAMVLQVTGSAASIAPLATALLNDTRVTAVLLSDSATAIDGLAGGLAPLAAKLGISLTAGGTVAAATLSLLAGAVSFAPNGASLALASNVAGVIGLSPAALGLAASVSISDVAANVTSAVLDSLRLYVAVPLSITLTDGGHISVTSATYTNDGTIIDDITNLGLVTVTGGAAAIGVLATTLNGDTRVGGVAITDTAANIQANYTSLSTLTLPLAVTLNGGGSVSASTLALLAASTLTAGSFVITLADSISGITGLTAAQRALAGAVAVTDSAGNLTGSAFDALHNDFAASVPLSITLSNPSVAVVVSAATYAADTAQVDAVQNATALQVTGNASAIAPLASTLLVDAKVSTVLLTDSATDIDGLVSQLAPLAAKLGITVSAGGTVGAATLAMFATAASLSLGGSSLSLADTFAGVTGLSAAALGLAAAVAVTDVTANLTPAALTFLQNNVSVPLSITLTGGGTVSLTSTVYSNEHATIEDITNTGVISVTGSAASIANLASLLTPDARVAGAVITDSAAGVQAQFGALNTIGIPLTIVLSGGGTVTAATLALLAGSTLTRGTFGITLADTLSDIAALSPAERLLASAVAVTDSAGDLTGSALGILQGEFAAAVPLTITLSTAAPLSFTAATFAAYTAQVNAVQNATSITITGATADIAPLATTLRTDSRITAVQLTDSATNIDAQETTLAPLAAKLAIAVNAGGTVGAATLTLLATAGGGVSLGGNVVTVATNVAGVLNLSAGALALAGGVAITDVAASFTTTALTTLYDEINMPLSITLNGGGHISVSTATYTYDQTTIDDITNTSVVIVTGTAAAIAGLASTLNNDVRVASVAITDGASALQANYTALAGLSMPIATTLNASGVMSASTLALISTGLTRAGFSITLADSMAGLATLTPAQRAMVGAVAITDTTSDLGSAALATLKTDFAASVPLTITLSDPGDTLYVTATAYSADTAQVDAVQNAAALVVTGAASDIAPLATTLLDDSRVTSVQLTDSATTIDGLVSQLSPLTDKLDITLTASGTVSAASLAMFAAAPILNNTGIDLALSSNIAGVNGLAADALSLAVSVTIADSSANLTTTALNALEAHVTVPLTITLSNAGPVSVSTTTYSNDANIIDDIANTGLVTVNGNAANIGALAYTLQNDAKVGSVVITDTAAAIYANYANLSLLNKPIAINLSGGGTVDANTLVLLAGSTLAAGSYVITLAASVADIVGLTSGQLAYAGAVVVTDSVGNLTATAFGELHSDVLVPLTIILSDPGDPLSVTAATYAANTAQVDAVSNATVLAVTGGAAALAPLAGPLATHAVITSVILTDSATAINSYVSAFANSVSLAGKLTIDLASGGTVGAATLSLFAAAAVFGQGGYALTLADAVAAVTGLGATPLSYVNTIAITDVSSALSTAALNSLATDASGKSLTITLTDTNPSVTVSAQTYLSDQLVIDAIGSSGVVTITAVPSDVAGLVTAGVNSDAHVAAIDITGTPALLQTYEAGMASLTVPFAVTLSAAGSVNAATLGVLAGATSLAKAGFALTLSDSIGNIATLASATPAALALASNVAITANTTDLTGTAFGSLKTDFSVPLSISLNDPQNALSVTAATYASDTAQVDAVSNATILAVTGGAVALAPLAGTLNADTKVTAVILTDSAATIDSNIASFTNLAALTGKLTIDLTGGGTVGAATLDLFAAAHAFAQNGAVITLQGAVADVTGLAAMPLSYVTTIDITDVSSALTTTALNTLVTDSLGKTLSITLNDLTPSVIVSSAVYASDESVIDAITNSGAVSVTGGAGGFGAIATALSTDSKVGAVLVSDTAANVVANLATMLTIGATLSVTLTDTVPIAVALVPSLVQLPSVIATGIVVADSGANIAAVIEAANPATLSFLNARPVQLNANSVVAALDAKSLVSLAQFSDNGFTLQVWDTAPHLTNTAYTAALQNAAITGIYLNTNGTTLTETAAGMLTLLGLPNFHTGNPSGSANSVVISDTTTHLSSSYTQLHNDAAALAGVAVMVNASATVTDAVLTQLQSLGATAAAGVVITVRDTAATIAADAPSQATGQSITPAAWDLSASATVSASVAAYLGGLSGFSAGAYTLTVSQVGSSVISVATANDLALLGSTLAITGGGSFAVQGTVAQLSMLSNAARLLVVPQISDTFNDIVTSLTNASTLLTGTLAVSDSETVTAASAAAFLGLIKVGSGAGIAASHVSFGSHIEAVSDTIADLRILTGLAAWSANPSLTAAFSLTAADSVANLISSANTSYLAGLSASTLSGNSTTTAASAESLFLIQNQIHFSLGGSTLTVQDTAANLLNDANADGVALATSLTLLGPDSTSAAGAETLLAMSKFDLTQVLTITDTSDNLLDGVLGPLLTAGNYGADVVVELSGATTLSAPTAASLVALSGFADPAHYLTISDDPSYLLDTDYLAAETAAAVVTIPTNETVSVQTVYRLDQVPHFTPGSNFLDLASNDTASAAQLAAVGDMGAQFNHNGFSITMTANATTLSATEYNALLSDDIVTNGHLLGAITPAPTAVSAIDTSGQMALTMNVAPNGTYLVFDASGNAVSVTATPQNGGANELLAFTDSVSNFTVTESLGAGAPSAPLVLLDTASIAAAAGGAPFSSTGGAGWITVGTNEYVQLVNALPGSVTVPVLVYNGTTHVLALDVPGTGLQPLITLGGTAPPSSLTLAEIVIKTHG